MTSLAKAQAAWAAACKAWSRDDASDVLATMKRGEAMMYAATDLICALEASIEGPPAEPSQAHNDAVGPLLAELWKIAERQPSRLNVLAESLLLGVAMLNTPRDPRRQALLIQAISDGAQDRAKAVGR